MKPKFFVCLNLLTHIHFSLQGLILSNALRAQKDAEDEGCVMALSNLRSVSFCALRALLSIKPCKKEYVCVSVGLNERKNTRISFIIPLNCYKLGCQPDRFLIAPKVHLLKLGIRSFCLSPDRQKFPCCREDSTRSLLLHCH